MEITEFKGVALDVHRTRLGAGLFQIDENGDRSVRGSWRRRRGRLHTTAPKQAAAVRTLIGFELPGTEFGLVVVAGATAAGVSNVTTRTVHVSGYGTDAYGNLGYGG